MPILTDHQAANEKADIVVRDAARGVSTAIGNAKALDPQMTLINVLPTIVDDMLQRMSDIYASLDGASEAPLHDDLLRSISDRVITFIRELTATMTADSIVSLADRLKKHVRTTAGKTFDLAVYEAHGFKQPLFTTPEIPVLTSLVDENASTVFEMLPLHPDIRAACGKQFADGHYREAILNAGIALVDHVKQRAGSPTDTTGKPLDNTPLMQRVFGTAAPILKVNDLKTPSDKAEQEGLMFLFAGVALGLRNPRAHSLDPDTAEYAIEAIALISFLTKVADAAKT